MQKLLYLFIFIIILKLQIITNHSDLKIIDVIEYNKILFYRLIIAKMKNNTYISKDYILILINCH